MNDEKIKDKIDDSDKTAIEDKVKETLDWLNDNSDADKDVLEEKLKELEAVSNPIMSKFYQGQGGAQQGGDVEHDEL